MKTTLHIIMAFVLIGVLCAQSLPVAKTGQVTSYSAGDDGELQRGVESQEPRFIDNGDGTVTDKFTGLMWVKAPHQLDGAFGEMGWANALNFCNDLEFAGYDDWVLPNRKELISLLDFGAERPALPDGHPFTGVQTERYWSSSSYYYTDHAWNVDMWNGKVGSFNKTGNLYVWPVRSER